MTDWDTLLEGARVRTWMEEHPREQWAFFRLDEKDELRMQLVEHILTGRNEEALNHLGRFADALEHRQRCFAQGILQPTPAVGERRPHDVWIMSMSRLEGDGNPFFRVDVRARDGWSGYFDTTTPQDVEKIAKMRDRSKLVVVVGEILKHRYDCFVVFGARTRLL